MRTQNCSPRLLALALAGVLAFAVAGPTLAESVRLPSGGVLEFALPDGWRVEPQANSIAVTLRLFETTAAQYPTLQITVFALPPGRAMRSIEELRAMVVRQGEDLLSTAVQTELSVEPIVLKKGAAFFYHLTDREQERGPGDFRELHQGFGELSDHTFSFTVLTHTGEAALVKTALGAVASISIASGE